MRSRIIGSYWRKIWKVLRMCIEFTRAQTASTARGSDPRRGRGGDYNRPAHARLRRFRFPRNPEVMGRRGQEGSCLFLPWRHGGHGDFTEEISYLRATKPK